MNADETENMTIEEVATLLHLSRTYIQDLISRGELPIARVTAEGEPRVARSAVIAYKRQMRAAQRDGLARMMEASERAGFYEQEADDLPHRHEKIKRQRKEE